MSLTHTFSLSLPPPKLLLISALLTLPTTANPTTLTTDIAIIGGGASGTYAAVRLREDLNTSILLIEPRPNLGGSVSTYRIPSTNSTFEYGVQSYLPYGPALPFFSRFNIATEPFTSKPLTALNVDVETGLKLTNYTPPSLNATTAAFERWLGFVEKYEDMLEPDYQGFPRRGQVPEVLLEPFGVFAESEGIEAAVPRIMTISGVGYGGVDQLLVLHIMQAFGGSMTRVMLSNSFVKPVGSNSLLYERALVLLGTDVLLSSTVQDVMRTSEGVELVVKQGSTEYLVKARRVLYAAPPSLSNLAPFHPDEKEKAVFGQWDEGGEYVGVAKIDCLPEGSSVSFFPSKAAPSDYLALKDYSYSIRLDSTGPTGSNLFRVVFGANFTLNADTFKEIVASSVQKLQDAGTVTGTCETEFKAVSSHSRPLWKQTAQQIQDGFVQELYNLQGYRGVWYVGYAWSVPYSSTVWAFVDSVLGGLVEDVRGGRGVE
ncbi:FAD/NAD(P)-binding domain-containing protein [Plenodomus tracheiphilus IPT5]|uniref:FAD/NAD(P)-binding domain-containing protein n=1 Tax=Plenodomus tracheiphilus IPT5 TaxID=1408161 RepID=A0A6A7B354_9PLEO|nr:FAD/NAD(P)-binding domain-containing protein [Plenodomus tracheiphilus IPT5]